MSQHTREPGLIPAIDPQDRADDAVLAEARERGFHLAVRCTACGQWLVAAKSVAAHLGPRCRSRAQEAE
ncbi:hypothetical protein [Nocardia salmonicida]|uniref:hypothetical protein n=1 Tax=Nocardia salmonicida TaxID=53431 RepID=UPI0036368BB0